jgi:hypothetical protein
MICEKCGKEHNGSYGSGRFCSASCARSYSTSLNRIEINKKVSNTLKNNFKKYVGKTKKELKEEKQLMYAQEIENKVKSMLETKEYCYIKYKNIDFGNRYIINKNGDIICTKNLKLLKHKAYNNDKYRRVVLHDVSGQKHLLYLHRIVATTYLPNPNNLPLINHKDENPANNNVDNLEWCTYLYNNTYNDTNLKRGAKISETIRKNGGPWNKGKKYKQHKK